MKVLDQAHGKNWSIYHGDSCQVIRGIPDNSVHFQIMSPPFSGLYCFSDSPLDISNTRSDQEFFEHYEFLVREQLRVAMPGRLCAIHVMQVPTSKVQHGYIGIRDFVGDVVRLFVGDETAELSRAARRLEKRAAEALADNDPVRAARLHAAAENIRIDIDKYPGPKGWHYHSEIAVWKNPATAMMRTKALGLLHKQIRKDAAMCRQGVADYILVFRKPGLNPEPVSNTHDTLPVPVWQRYASPVWATAKPEPDDEGFVVFEDPNANNPDKNGINQTETLQYRSAREQADEKHISPLQTEVIKRCIRLWSNKGDTVASFFGGIGSEGVVAVDMERKAILVELKGSYYRQAVANLRNAEAHAQSDLFASFEA